MQFVFPRLSPRMRAAGLAIVLASAACSTDQPTGLRSSLNGRASFTSSTPLGNYSIPVPPDNRTDPTAPTVGTGIVVPAGTYFRVRVVGNITAQLHPLWVNCPGGTPQGGTFGPAGSASWYGSKLQVVLRGRNIDSTGTGSLYFLNPVVTDSTAQTDVQYASKAIEIEAGRLGIDPVCDHNDGTGLRPAYQLSGNQMVFVDVITNAVQLTAAPKAVHPNVEVTFTASRDEGGDPRVNSWHWQPDAGQDGATDPCWWLNPCRFSPRASGTMTVQTQYGPASAHVTVYSNFALNADQSSVYVGDTVHFTPTYDGVAAPAKRWNWVPSDTATGDEGCAEGTGACAKLMIVSGRMWAYSEAGDSAHADVTVQLPTLSVDVDQEKVGEGDTAIFTGTMSPARPAYHLTWSWNEDEDAAPITNRRPRTTTSGLRAAPSVPRFSEVVDDSTVEAVGGELPAPLKAPGTTAACTTSSLTCTTEIYGAGHMKLSASLYGRTVSASAPAATFYICPETYPTDGMVEIGNVVVQASPEKLKFFGTPLPDATITLVGPWKLLRQEDPQGGWYPRGDYRPTGGFDSNGRSVVVSFLQGAQPIDSWATFWCKTWLKKDGTFTGRIQFANHWNVDLARPAAP